MKRIVTLLLAAGLMLGASTSAQAVDINISGMYDFTAQWGRAYGDKNSPRLKNHGGVGSNNVFYQRFRTQIDIIASESLQGVLFFEIGDQVWGKSTAAAGRGAGGGIGADGVSVEVRRAYIDWIVPQTELQVRIGIQGFALPNLTGLGSQVFDDDVAGITAAYQFNETVGMTAFWLRPFADNQNVYDTNSGLTTSRRHTKMDMVGITVPLTFDGVAVTPWGMYSRFGRDAFGDGTNSYYSGPTTWTHWNQMLPRWAQGSGGGALPFSDDTHADAWWAGISTDITFWNPFRLALDFNYGYVDAGNIGNLELERQGWIVSGIAEYKLDFMTPGLFFWYGSGDDSDGRDGSEMMPQIKASSRFTTFGQDGITQNFMNQGLESGLAGTWGIGAQLKDMSFIEDLKHTFRVAYYRGTNHRDMAREGWVAEPWNGTYDATYLYLTKNDSAWEFNLDTTYDIYKNLQLGVELGYIKLRLSESNWGRDIKDRQDSMYKVGVGLRYTF